jgi:tetratricopeptide (TPR) repeat protein
MDETARTGELRRKLEKDPGSRLFAQLAEELRKEGKHDEAISVARKGLEKNPNYPSARLTLARALLDSGRPKEARPELEQIVKASPDNIMASRLLGDALEQVGEAQAALAQFEKTLRLSPGDKVVVERIAELKAKSGQGPGGPEAATAPAAAPAPSPAPAPKPASLPPTPAAATPAAPLPSVFGDEAAAMTLAPAPLSAPAATTPAPAPPAAAVALDRDLASGTFSPGALNAADIQKHFDETAAGADSAPPADVNATVAFGGLQATPPAPGELPATLPPAALPAAAPAGIQELPSLAPPSVDSDPGGQTLPLTSLTLADLYLEQGLKTEASAVLSQVLKEEPENELARSKLAAVSSELSGTAPSPAEPAVASPAPGAVISTAPAPPTAPRTKAEVRERTILALKAFAGAVEREAQAQKATERGAY